VTLLDGPPALEALQPLPPSENTAGAGTPVVEPTARATVSPIKPASPPRPRTRLYGAALVAGAVCGVLALSFSSRRGPPPVPTQAAAAAAAIIPAAPPPAETSAAQVAMDPQATPDGPQAAPNQSVTIGPHEAPNEAPAVSGSASATAATPATSAIKPAATPASGPAIKKKKKDRGF
jgi:hypothetical protein